MTARSSRIVAADRTSSRFLALLGVTTPGTLGHDLGHVVTHALAASWPADQISRGATFGTGLRCAG